MYVIGLDEVGRGSLAGPVVVAAAALPEKLKLPKLKDSKKLTPQAREHFWRYAKKSRVIFFETARVYPSLIDEINISQAANLAATRALERLLKKGKFGDRKLKVFLDGGLYLLRTGSFWANGYLLKAKTVVKGDERIDAIKLASVVAKVVRDRYMLKIHQLYPQYGFNFHKGYGTKFHRQAIRRYGLLKIHRKSFRVNLER
jgi:ribonuclease HII